MERLRRSSLPGVGLAFAPLGNSGLTGPDGMSDDDDGVLPGCAAGVRPSLGSWVRLRLSAASSRLLVSPTGLREVPDRFMQHSWMDEEGAVMGDAA
jgi:hypothetical protein